MKRICFLLFFTTSLGCFAQKRLVTQAVIMTTTTITSSEPEDGNISVSNTPTTSSDGAEVRVMRFGGDGETKTSTWLKNDLVKTFSESEMGRTTVIRDNAKKITTTIMEMMGRQSGFYATDEDQAAMRKRMDSMMQGRGQNAASTAAATLPAFSVEYFLNESKKIAGYDCKKALIIAKRPNRVDTTIVWVCPDFKLQNLPSTGGMAAGFAGFNTVSGPTGMELLDGFPLRYERNMNRGRHMTVEVTKLVIGKDIADKEFVIPKDIEIKSIKDMQNGPGGGPGFQMRIGG